ncbi:MarR family transcriptional regulator (plasmid) [Burkholderia sp. FERM BP-3421]|jgi:MarR family transcriptional regulator, multiple antibiotic resistance protein MarR|uniref:MarR family winged helix-turn-helix transcriptional regulator n=1 Tax=Burkholderia sp. FERM BP-3421 TaxID=1494466 RepID=UPI00235EE98A|nr:MarR family transcriptional regulator [Burkholderia sp. FERM BP-3421]WDD90676.1 MarR family transcriptional regulator [Burkholderia sp. FERM BP-3421]
MSREKALGLPSGEIYSMTNIVRNRDRRLTTELGRIGLTLPEWRVLRIIHSFAQDVPMSVIIEHSQTDRTALGRTIDRLVERGWVERLPDPDDKRAVYIRRRPASCVAFTQALQVVSQWDTQLMAGLDAVERGALSRALKKLDDASL